MHKSLRPFIGGSHQIYLVICKVIRVAQRTEDWRASLDRREAVAVVAVDSSKAFDSVCLPLLLAKLKAYGFTDDGLGLTTAYLLAWPFVIQFLCERSQLLCV